MDAFAIKSRLPLIRVFHTLVSQFMNPSDGCSFFQIIAWDEWIPQYLFSKDVDELWMGANSSIGQAL